MGGQDDPQDDLLRGMRDLERSLQGLPDVEHLIASAVLIGLSEALALVTSRLAHKLADARPDLEVPDPPPIPSAGVDLEASAAAARAMEEYEQTLGPLLDRALADGLTSETDAGMLGGLMHAELELLARRKLLAQWVDAQHP